MPFPPLLFILFVIKKIRAFILFQTKVSNLSNQDSGQKWSCSSCYRLPDFVTDLGTSG